MSPIHNMCRVAREDYPIGGVTVDAGQQVVLLYSSANRDAAHFSDPEAFDVRRTPNNHIAFGLGTHFCLGAGLARLEIRVFFEEFVRRVRDMRLGTGTRRRRDAERLRLWFARGDRRPRPAPERAAYSRARGGSSAG